MYQAPRNAWLKIIYNKIPSGSSLYESKLKDIESDRCQQFNEVEDAKHLLMDCGNELDVFSEHLSYLITANIHCIYKDLQNSTLSRYFMYNLDLQNNIFDLLATTIRVI